MKFDLHHYAKGFARMRWIPGIVAILMITTGCTSGVSDGTGGAGGIAATNSELPEYIVKDLIDEHGQASAAAPPSNATTCTSGPQCPSGYCVDGFCCDTKCDNKCMACSAAKKGSGVDGVCGSIAYDTDPDGECPQGRCDGKNQCKFYNGYSCTSTAQCLSNYCVDGFCCGNICMGACQACSAVKKGSGGNGVCGNIAAGTNPDAECASGGTCNGSGTCSTSITKLANGAACSSAAQCTSGFCADGVCCDNWCLGTCQACSAARKGQGTDGTCGNIANDKDPDEECWGGACNGTGVCKQYNGVLCTDKAQCLSGYCVDGFCCGNICSGSCQACSEAKKGQGYDGVCGVIASGKDPDNECNPGECNGSGTCNQSQTPLANGATCISGGQCISGNCVDGYCCNSACTGTCQACSVAKKGSGVNGTCGNIVAETDPDTECGVGGRCGGNGTCRYYNGAPCSSTAQCFSNYCADGVCCGNICNLSCMACTAAKKGSGTDGTCGMIPANTDPDNECTLSCTGTGSCQKVPNGGTCTLASDCLSGNCADGVCCDTACTGACQACTAVKKGSGSDGTCGPIAINTDPDNECVTNCNGNGACMITTTANGATCSSNTQCASGFCVDGVCCNNVCSGACMACNMPGTEGKCASSCTPTCSSGKVALGQAPIGPLRNVPQTATGIAVPDLNGDGIRDIAVAQGNNVTVFTRQSNGTLNPGVDYAAGTGATAITHGDFNADGKVDLAVVNTGSNDVSVLLNQGNGTFAAKVDYSVGSAYSATATADLNGDGKLDLVVGSLGSGLYVFLNQGNGTFGTAVQYTQTQPAYSISLTDVNADGIIDIVTSNIFGVGVHRGQGNGTFAPYVEVATYSSPVTSVAAADLNGDGLGDIAVTFGWNSDLGVLLGQGNTTFAPMVKYGMCGNGVALVVADVTGDGKLDLVASNESYTITLYRNLGNGTFTGIGCYPAGTANSVLVAGDMNGDGRTDLTMAGARSFNILTNQGGGVFGTATNLPTYPTGASPQKILTADFNGDGNADLVTGNGTTSVSVFLGQGNGSFAAKVDYASGELLTMADINGDARPDIIDTKNGEVGVLMNQGNGTFGARTILSTDFGYSYVVAELNGDGFADLVYATYKSSWQSINGTKYPSENKIWVRLNQGNGTFGTATLYDMGGIEQSYDYPYKEGLRARDLNGDGRKDLVFGHVDKYQVYVRLHDNTSNLVFTPYSYAAAETPFVITMADHTGDGYPDIAIGDFHFPNSMHALLQNNGAGGFLSNYYSLGALQQNPLVVADGDVVGDSVTEIVAPAGYSIRASSSIQSSGEYAATTFYATGTIPTAVVVADFNNDGRPDVASANGSTNNMTVLLSSCMP